MDVAWLELPFALPLHWLCFSGLQCLDALQARLHAPWCILACVRHVRPFPIAVRRQHGHRAVGRAGEDSRACQGALSIAVHGQVHEVAQRDEGELTICVNQLRIH